MNWWDFGVGASLGFAAGWVAARLWLMFSNLAKS